MEAEPLCRVAYQTGGFYASFYQSRGQSGRFMLVIPRPHSLEFPGPPLGPKGQSTGLFSFPPSPDGRGKPSGNALGRIFHWTRPNEALGKKPRPIDRGSSPRAGKQRCNAPRISFSPIVSQYTARSLFAREDSGPEPSDECSILALDPLVLLDGFDRDRIVLDQLRAAMSRLIIIGHGRLLDAGPAREPRNVTPLSRRWASGSCAERGARQALVHWAISLARPTGAQRAGAGSPVELAGQVAEGDPPSRVHIEPRWTVSPYRCGAQRFLLEV
jgi:hypothetical protein